MAPGLIVATTIGLTVGLVAMLILRGVRTARERRVALRQAAATLGWTYVEEVSFDAIPDLGRFELFKAGRSQKLNNLMTSPPGDLRAVVFDYSYVTGAGKSQRTNVQTVCYVTSDALDVPGFSLRPENFFHRIAELFGYQDIDFTRRPEFSKLFVLRGDDESRIRAAFDESLLGFFEERPRTCAAGMHGEVLLWRPGAYTPPEGLPGLIRDGDELARPLLQTAG